MPYLLFNLSLVTLFIRLVVSGTNSTCRSNVGQQSPVLEVPPSYQPRAVPATGGGLTLISISNSHDNTYYVVKKMFGMNIFKFEINILVMHSAQLIEVNSMNDMLVYQHSNLNILQVNKPLAELSVCSLSAAPFNYNTNISATNSMVTYPWYL